MIILAYILRAFYLVLKKIIVFGIFSGVIVWPSKSSLLRYSLFIKGSIAASTRKYSKVYNLIVFLGIILRQKASSFYIKAVYIISVL